MRRDKPSLRQIEAFLAVVDAGSFRRAAERCGLSQPTLTAQVATLEKLIGARLFERSRAGTRVSRLGSALITNARRIVEEVDGFVDAAAETRGGPGGRGVRPSAAGMLRLQKAIAGGTTNFRSRESRPSEPGRRLSPDRAHP